MCTRFNIDVIKSQLDLIQQASPYQNRLYSPFFPLLSFCWLVLFSGSSMNIFFSQTHSLVSRWSSLNTTYQNKRVKRAVVSFLFFIIIHFLFSSLIRTTKHHSLIIQKEEEKKTSKKEKKSSTCVCLSFFMHITLHID